jgi:UPF0755 protein
VGCRKYLHSLLTIVAFSLLLGLGGTYFFWRAITTPFKGYTDSFRQVEIIRGVKTSSIIRHLQHEGIVRDAYIPIVYLKLLRRGDSLKAGVYQFDKPMSAAEVLDRVIKGDVILRSVTVREGLDRFAVGRLFAAEGFGRNADWDKLTADAETIRDIDPDARSLEGYLFPDTYKFNPGTPPHAILQAMTENFRKHIGGELAFITTGLSLHQTVILASIVETETRLPQERPLVASVYLNRLHRNMLLGCDPTVIYALKLAHRWDGNIRKADLSMDSPYNTYRVQGLPPGPVANPGLASLRAAAAPAKSDYLYFVARHDGAHAFATNLEEHNRNVQIYQVQWYRDHRDGK